MAQGEKSEFEAGDLTPVVGAETDVAPLGRDRQKPAHELTADEDVDVADWERVAATDEFKRLVAEKRKFIVPATVFFITYYFALPVLVGYAPQLMDRKVFGVINLAYLFALSQFFMAWVIAALYVRAAGRFDEMARRIISRVTKGGR
ncbi:MAG TPA: DUF485 domain-containing protein [Blastocatellia bacterium]|nr:DUF485 domain-containing protein [Blastocatellia bacterium]